MYDRMQAAREATARAMGHVAEVDRAIGRVGDATGATGEPERGLWLGVSECATEGCRELTTGIRCAQCQATMQHETAERELSWGWLLLAGLVVVGSVLVLWRWVTPGIGWMLTTGIGDVHY